MKTYKSTDITRKSGRILEDAIRGPVSITKHNRSTYVIMSAKHYDKIIHANDDREVFSIDAVPTSVKDEMLMGIEQELSRD
jgi:prevent-host-death family protein